MQPSGCLLGLVKKTGLSEEFCRFPSSIRRCRRPGAFKSMASFFVRRKRLLVRLLIGSCLLWLLFATFRLSRSHDGSKAQYDVDYRDADQDGRRVAEHPNPRFVAAPGDGPSAAKAVPPLQPVVLPAHRMPWEQPAPNAGGGDGPAGNNRLNIPPPNVKTQTTMDPNSPGEQGRGVEIKKEELSPEQRQKYDQGFADNAFNQYASDMMSLHRSLPDVRDEECKPIVYSKNLPDTSVIVCFHNEAWSVLLRTVHSILDRSPPELIREIVLVDDFSDKEHLKTQLEEYVAKLGKVKIFRTQRREGLIRARLLGASKAVGTVLTFLDSHCECATGWLEPLLEEIHRNKTNVVTPVIDVIDDETLKFMYGSAKATSVGGFDWSLTFNWHAIPKHEIERRRGNDLAPIWSPTMAGGLFSISKEYFEYLGTYDAGMDIWGGENLELSFRVWMCGGTLLIVPCSHVGHIFRKRSPYSWKNGENVLKKNTVRLAEVWLDDYKKYYYDRINNDLGNYGDISERKALRQRLGCKSFDWYMKNIYPDLFVPGDAIASGDIRNKARPTCLDSAAEAKESNKPVKMWPCHNQGGNQYWMLSKTGEIRRDDMCMDWTGQGDVTMYSCHGMGGNQDWIYTSDNHLQHAVHKMCMATSTDGQSLLMLPCQASDDHQIWYWNRKLKS